jgi:ATP-binding cassette subfamily F protein uup
VRQRVKLSFKEQRELAALPGEIEALETELAALHQRMSGAGYHKHGPAAIKADGERVAEIDSLLPVRYERWEALEQLAAAAAS